MNASKEEATRALIALEDHGKATGCLIENSKTLSIVKDVPHRRPPQATVGDPPNVVHDIFFQQCGGGRRIIRKKIGGI